MRRTGTHVIRRAKTLVRGGEVVWSRAETMPGGRVASALSRARVDVRGVTPNVAMVLRIVSVNANGAVVRGVLDKGGRAIASAVLETNSAATVSIYEIGVAPHRALANAILSGEGLSLGIVSRLAEVTVEDRGEGVFNDGMRGGAIDREDSSMVVEPLLRGIDGVVVGGRRRVRGISIESESRPIMVHVVDEGLAGSEIDNLPRVQVDLDELGISRVEAYEESSSFHVDSEILRIEDACIYGAKSNLIVCRIRRDESVSRERIVVVGVTNVNSPELVSTILEKVEVGTSVGDVFREGSITRARVNLKRSDSLEGGERELVDVGGRSWSGVDVASGRVESDLDETVGSVLDDGIQEYGSIDSRVLDRNKPQLIRLTRGVAVSDEDFPSRIEDHRKRRGTRDDPSPHLVRVSRESVHSELVVSIRAHVNVVPSFSVRRDRLNMRRRIQARHLSLR